MTGIPSGRAMLLASVSEESWQEQVMDWAHQGGWCGVHVRSSVNIQRMGGQFRRFAVLMGIHARRRRDNHDDDDGLPDWLFWREGGPFIAAELKTVSGVLEPDQRRYLHLFNTIPGMYGVCWRPTDADNVRTILIGHDWRRLDMYRVYLASPDGRANLKRGGHSPMSIGQSSVLRAVASWAFG